MNKLQLNDYSFSYPDGPQILSHVSLELQKGDFICLCGPNGAGKSTLLHGLADSCDLKNPKERAQKLSFLTQNESALWDYSVFETVLSGRFCHTGKLGHFSKRDYETASQAICEFGIESLSEKSVLEISGGEFQKVRLARSFAQGADFLLMDEPLSSLDFVASEKFMKLLKEKCKEHEKAVIVSIHDINMAARFADKIILLGKCDGTNQLCLQGSVQEVLNSENLSRVYESAVKVYQHPELGIPQI